MGIIIRQSIKQTIIAMVAVGISGVAQLFIYANHREVSGEAYAIMNIALFLVPIVSFGLPSAVIRYFTRFGEGQKGYILNFIILAAVSLAAMGGVYLLLRPWILRGFEFLQMSNSRIFEEYKWTIIALIVLTILFKLLSSLSANYKRIVWPGIFDLLWGKTALAIVISVVIFGWLPLESFHYTLPGFMLVSVIGIAIYLKYLGVLNLTFNKSLFQSSTLKEIGSFSAFSGLNSLGGMLATRIDLIMVPTIIGITENGAYTLFIFMAQVIDLPSRSMMSIAAPIISKSLSTNDMEEVRTIYDKSSMTLMMISIGLFALIFLNLNDLFKITNENDYMDGLILVFVALGVGQILSTTFKASAQIILYSPYFKYLLYITLLLGVLNLTLNHLFINYWMVDRPLIGVSVATAISLCVYISGIVAFVKIKYNLLPFQKGMLKAILIFVSIGLLAYAIPLTEIPLVDIVIRSALFSMLSIVGIYYFKVSLDINAVLERAWLAIKNRDFKNLI